MTQRKAKSARNTKAPFPTDAEIAAFVESRPGKAGKREIARAFNIRGPDRIELKRVLKRMTDEGLIAGTKKRLRKPGAPPHVAVLDVIALDEDGEPIAVPASWDESDQGPPPRILITGEDSPRRGPRGRNAKSRAPGVGDRVLARTRPASGNRQHGPAYEGRVIKRLDRRAREVFGVIRKSADGSARLEPIDKKSRGQLRIESGAEKNANDGDLVAVELTRKGTYGLPGAKVLERIGPLDDHRSLSMIAIAEHDIPHRFPSEVVDAAADLAEADLSPLTDLTDVPFVTIDPQDARDHDDAVWAQPLGKADKPSGWEIMVAIADVSLYVRTGSVIDREARNRGNSVYFPDRVVPMLPERLSNDLCSLKAGEIRPVLVTRMKFDANGNRTGHKILRARIRPVAKLAYPQAQAAIDGRTDETTGPLLEPVLKPRWAAYGALTKARDKREPLDLDLPERKITFDEDGNMSGVTVPPRLDAHRLIEEFMIQANVAAAESLLEKAAPAVHRFHDVPAPEKVEALNDFLETLDLSFPKSGTVKPEQFNRLIEKVRGRGIDHMMAQVVLRSQAQAIYSAGESGHFGLNLKRYVHFTSPIRRYSDLIVHRALIATLGLGPGGLDEAEAAKLEETAAHISSTERRAMAAERDTVDRMCAAFLSSQIGATFSGRITGLIGAGLFIQLSQTGADGFVPVSTLDRDYFVHDERTHSLRGERTGETFSLGDQVEVRLAEASAASGALRLELLSQGRIEKAKGKPVRRRPAPRRKSRKRR